MGLDDGATNRESKANATDTIDGTLERLFEDALLIAGRQPRAVVADRKYDACLAVCSADLDRTVRRRVLGDIFQQIDHHLLDQNIVHSNQGHVRRNTDLDLPSRK